MKQKQTWGTLQDNSYREQMMRIPTWVKTSTYSTKSIGSSRTIPVGHTSMAGLSEYQVRCFQVTTSQFVRQTIQHQILWWYTLKTLQRTLHQWKEPVKVTKWTLKQTSAAVYGMNTRPNRLQHRLNKCRRRCPRFGGEREKDQRPFTSNAKGHLWTDRGVTPPLVITWSKFYT